MLQKEAFVNNYNETEIQNCIKCNICQVSCPVNAHYPDFPGPRTIGPDFERLEMSENVSSIDIELFSSLCLSCGRCDSACPHNVNPSFRNIIIKARSGKLSIKALRDWILAHNVWWGMMGSKMPSIFNLTLKMPLTKFFMNQIGIAKRDFPEFRKSNYGKYIRDDKSTKKKVLYFPGCYARYNNPDIIKAVIRIMEHSGYSVTITSCDCCGTPMITNAFLNESKAIAMKNSKNIVKYINEGYKIICSCPSCILALKKDYARFVPEETVSLLNDNVMDVFEFLNSEGKEFKYKSESNIEKIFYHIPCHMRARGIGIPLFPYVAKHKNIITENRFCCGIAGTYGFKSEKFELSKKIGETLFSEIVESKASKVMTECGTCSIQIASGTGLSVIHPAVFMEEVIEGIL